MMFDYKIAEGETSKFFGLQIESNLNWKKHDHIAKLSLMCFATGTVTSLMRMLKLIYFAYFHFIMSY
jgi:hypothetical protein